MNPTQPSPAYLHLRQERPEDHYAVESITREAHWDGNWDMQPQICDTHLLVHRLRQCPSYVPKLHYVAELEGKLVGHIMYCASKIVDDAGKTYETLTFGPLSVLPEYQGQGIGKTLMQHTFEKAKHLRAAVSSGDGLPAKYRAILIFGHPDYYPRVGFKRASEFGITDSSGKSYDPFMAYLLYEGALDGVSGRYYIDPAYENLTQEDILAFDKKFPPKEMHIPVSINALLDRLSPSAQKALEGLKEKSLMIMQTKSEREITSLDGIDTNAIETIRAVMREHGCNWGQAR
ncbi:MAG: N-acetyltransferase [Defluviitaleaceae bacterium]|nr:N-acetyltransferase [Defluviitaleaceae bacterium]